MSPQIYTSVTPSISVQYKCFIYILIHIFHRNEKSWWDSRAGEGGNGEMYFFNKLRRPYSPQRDA